MITEFITMNTQTQVDLLLLIFIITYYASLWWETIVDVYMKCMSISKPQSLLYFLFKLHVAGT